MRYWKPVCLLVILQILTSNSLSAQQTVSLDSLEARLLTAQSLSFEFEVTASGAIEAEIAGSLSKTSSGVVDLVASGVFAGQAVDLVVSRDGQEFKFGNRNDPVSQQPPAQLWEALVIGVTRMGVLHNIATLSAGMPPDHAEGGVADWVLVTNVEGDNTGFAFDIVVSGVPSGAATLAVDESGNPQLRQQTVEFPTGAMIVTERYSDFRVQ